jgi:ApbE superfamily uncharacterized protein (UPF0280 family)
MLSKADKRWLPEEEGKIIYSLKDGTVLVDEGPAQVSISVVKNGRTDLSLAREGAGKVISLLRELAASRTIITQNITLVRDKENTRSSVVARMISAARQAEDRTVTPLVCVAGAVADEVADFIFEDKAVSRVIVNNGGDIAIRLRGESTARAGIRPDISRSQVSHVLTLDAGSQVGGIATSGFGGRSFTKGIASAAAAVASNASIADVAATLIANATNIDDTLIERQPAEDIYPDTDIPGHLVTTKIGDIDRAKVLKALENGLKKASEFQRGRLIFGALIAVKGEIRITEALSPMIESVQSPLTATVTR